VFRHSWEPFALRCRLATPVALNHPWLHLDGIIAHLIQLRVRGREYYNLPTKVLTHVPPGHRYQHVLATSGGGLVHASVSQFEPETRLTSLQYFKRFEADRFPRKRKVERGSGHYRDWMLRWVLVSAEWCTFYGVGDIALLRELLEDLTHLGNDTRVGWGRVQRWELIPWSEDWSLVRDGRAMRPIPVRFLRSYSDAVPLAWKPPYWAAEHVELCAPPGAEVVLR